MNNYEKLIGDIGDILIAHPSESVSKMFLQEASVAIEQLVREINYCPTDTLRKYHAWLLEQFHNNPTSEILHSIDTAIGWLKAYAEYRDINVSFGVGNTVDWSGIK